MQNQIVSKSKLCANYQTHNRRKGMQLSAGPTDGLPAPGTAGLCADTTLSLMGTPLSPESHLEHRTAFTGRSVTACSQAVQHMCSRRHLAGCSMAPQGWVTAPPDAQLAVWPRSDPHRWPSASCSHVHHCLSLASSSSGSSSSCGPQLTHSLYREVAHFRPWGAA